MKILSLLTLCILAFTICGCTNFKSGNYITVSIKSHDDNLSTLSRCNGDTLDGKSINSFLKEKLSSRKYQIKVKKDFTVLKDFQENEEHILALESDESGDYYATDISKGVGKEQFHLELRPNGREKLILVVDLYIPNAMSYRPVQLGGKLASGSSCGRAICYLSNLD